MFRSVTRAPRLNVGRIMKQWPDLYSSSWFCNPDCLHLGLALQWPSLLRNSAELTAAMRSFFWQIYFCACRVRSSIEEEAVHSANCEANKRKLPPHASWVCDFEPWNRRVKGVRRDQQGLDKQCIAGIDSLLTVMFNSCGMEPCHNMNRLAREKFDTSAATFLRLFGVFLTWRQPHCRQLFCNYYCRQAEN